MAGPLLSGAAGSEGEETRCWLKLARCPLPPAPWLLTTPPQGYVNIRVIINRDRWWPWGTGPSRAEAQADGAEGAFWSCQGPVRPRAHALMHACVYLCVCEGHLCLSVSTSTCCWSVSYRARYLSPGLFQTGAISTLNHQRDLGRRISTLITLGLQISKMGLIIRQGWVQRPLSRTQSDTWMLNKLEILLNRRNQNKIKEQNNLLLTTVTPWEKKCLNNKTTDEIM